MNMNILFRAKKKSSNDWIEGYYAKVKHYLSEEDVHVIFPLDTILYPHSEFSEYEEIDPETLGRLVNYPCYSDWTDQRYFQGDIIELYSEKWKIYNGTIGVVVDEHCFTENGMGRRFPQDTLQARVIGNVYDNPELIGKKYADLYKYYFGYCTSVTRDDLERNNKE